MSKKKLLKNLRQRKKTKKSLAYYFMVPKKLFGVSLALG